ncbi:MAG TPA: restriction endonuclease subunit S [Maribacter sp.]|nr:restriction endonuclease subunit S [Maribacter sp.]
MLQLAVGMKVFGVSKTQLIKVKLPLPPTITEQKAIARVITDTDALIQALEKKIAKKKLIKKGMMQKLLTPKKGWSLKKLGNLCETITTGKLDANAMVKDGAFRFYTCAKEYYYIDNYSFDTEALLVSGNGANVGYIHYYKGKFNAYQRTYVLSGFKQNILFIKQFMDKNLKIRIDDQKNDGNTPYIKMDTLTEMEIYYPQIEELKQIVHILSDIDKEIAQLVQKLSKYQLVKQGMVQQLLTGRVRLV